MSDLDEAFKKIKRANFVPDYALDSAYLDVPLPIGFGQTISQPSTVYMMLEWLEPEPGDKILDVGSGSGWTSGLLAFLVGLKGHVFAVDRINELVEFGRRNCRKMGLRNVEFHLAGKDFGLKQNAPYDKILVSASYIDVPKVLLDQLKIGGKMVIPVREDVLEVTKLSGQKTEILSHPGFAFVPLVKGYD